MKRKTHDRPMAPAKPMVILPTKRRMTERQTADLPPIIAGGDVRVHKSLDFRRLIKTKLWEPGD